MKAPPPRPTELPVLTANEEVTLRRVAFGQSEVRAMRAKDLTQLRQLGLIKDAKDGPQLTARGSERFAALPKAMTLGSSGSSEALLSEMTRVLGKTPR